MNRIISTLCAAAVAATAFVVSPAMAAPQISLQVGASSGAVLTAQNRRDNRRDCTARQALNKAERLGLRRARVVRETRRSIAVSGVRRGDRVVVTFARDRACTIRR